MTAKNKDFSGLLKREHVGNWVAIAQDYSKVLGYAADLRVLKTKVQSHEAFYTKVPDPKFLYAF